LSHTFVSEVPLARRERDHNIWKSPGGALFFKLGIPPDLRGHFLSTTGRPKVKISEPLGTYDPHEAREIRDQKLAHWKQTFRRLESGVPLLPEDIAAEAERIREETLATLRAPATEEQRMRLEIARAEAEVEAMRRARDAVRRTLDQVSAGVASVAERHGIDVEKGTALYAEIANAVFSAIGDAAEIHNAETGTPDALPVEQPAPAPAVGTNGDLERFSVALDHYLAWLRDEQKCRVATVADYKSKAERFMKFANDPSLGAVTIDQAKTFLNEVAKNTAPATVNLYHIACKSVFEHARKERHRFSGANPFSFKRRKSIAQSKAKFTVDELNGLFNSPTFAEREIKPATYGVTSALPWAALVALYSGASLEEVAQLRPDDLHVEDGNGWVISILPEAALSGELKRKSRKRIIPLHPELERLGLLEYRAALPRGAEWLFPGLRIQKSKGKRSPQLGSAFNNWRRSLGIDYQDRQLDFHSLRRTFGRAIEDIGITATDCARLLGHAVPGISSSVYSAPELKRVAPLVARVKWDGLRVA
jgi:integrase